MLAGAVVTNGKGSYSRHGSVPSRFDFLPHPHSHASFLFFLSSFIISLRTCLPSPHYFPHLSLSHDLTQALSLLRPIICPLSFPLIIFLLSLSRRFYHFSSDKQRPGYCPSWQRTFFFYGSGITALTRSSSTSSSIIFQQRSASSSV